MTTMSEGPAGATAPVHIATDELGITAGAARAPAGSSH